MQNKITLITGSTSGIGAETAKALAKKGHHVFLLARNAQKVTKLISEIVDSFPEARLEFVPLDLASMASVKEAAKHILSLTDHIDVLINNAGGIFPKREITVDGVEMSISVNHLGHFLLFHELLTALKKGKARVINVSSMAHFGAKVNWEDVQMEKAYTHFLMYSNVKLFNALFAKEIARRYFDNGVTAFSLHPGVVRTNFGLEFKGIINSLIKLAQPFMISAAKGAETSVYLATAEGVEKWNGLYFKKKKPAKMSKTAQSERMAKKLWEWSERKLGELK